MREVIKTASSKEEAIALALEELDLTRDRVTVEVTDVTKKGFIFKKEYVTVKVTEKEDDFSVKDLFAQPEKETFKKEKKEKKPENKKPEIKSEEPKKEEQNRQEETEEKRQPEEYVIPEEEQSAKLKYAMEFLKGILSRFNEEEYTLTPVKSETGCTIKISGRNVGALIGRKGETMEALSYLTGLAANRTEDSFEKITVDVADYRHKREGDLVHNAKKRANKVLKTGRPFGFEPMNPYERRIIHATVSEIEGVKSESKGEGSSRRVVIYPTNPRSRYNNNRDRGGRKPYNKNSSRREKSEPQAQKTRDEKLNDSRSFGLYSKIEL